MNKIAVYPGSFDPPHYGHINVLREACSIFDKVIILVSVNSAKKEFLSQDERHILWDKIKSDEGLDSKLDICFNENELTANWMRDRELKYMIRGVRNSRDFDEEMMLHSINSKIYNNISTIFIPANPRNSIPISSSIIRELIKYKKKEYTALEWYAPKYVLDFLMQKF